MRLKERKRRPEEAVLNIRKQEEERRKWPRLPLAIPIFVRSKGEQNKDLLEFASALNVSAGGALVAVRRSLPLSAQVSIEIPTAPFAAGTGLVKPSRLLLAKTVRVTHTDEYHLIGLQFDIPLSGEGVPRSAS